MSKSPIKTVTLEQITDNAPYELDIPGIGLIKIKDPSNKDRYLAREDAKKLPFFDELSEIEQDGEVQRQLARRMLVEPTMSFDQFLDADGSKVDVILDTISLAYAVRVKALNDKRAGLIKGFLDQIGGKNQ